MVVGRPFHTIFWLMLAKCIWIRNHATKQKIYIQKSKILLILCLTLTFIVSFASVTPSGMSSAQNNTLMQPQGA